MTFKDGIIIGILIGAVISGLSIFIGLKISDYISKFNR